MFQLPGQSWGQGWGQGQSQGQWYDEFVYISVSCQILTLSCRLCSSYWQFMVKCDIETQASFSLYHTDYSYNNGTPTERVNRKNVYTPIASADDGLGLVCKIFIT